MSDADIQPVEPTRGAPQRIDPERWKAIRTEYIAGYDAILRPTLEELAIRHAVSRSAIEKRSTKEKWGKLRKLHWERVEQERINKQVAKLGDRSVKFNLDAIELAERGMREIMRWFETQQRQRPDQQLKSIDLNNLSMAAERFQKIGRLSMGQSTEHGEQMVHHKGSVSLEDFNVDQLRTLENLVLDLDTGKQQLQAQREREQAHEAAFREIPLEDEAADEEE